MTYRKKILVRIDGAGATHDLLEYLHQLNLWRRVRFAVGWTITDADEAAIGALPADAWTHSLNQDGTASTSAAVAELTGLDAHAEAWLPRLRLITRRTKPAAQRKANLTALGRATGWRYAIVATDITRMWGIAGSHHPQWIDALHRAHPTVEDWVRTNKTIVCATCPRSQNGQPRLGSGCQPCRRHQRPGPACWACTTRPIWPTPNPTPCDTGCCTCPRN